MAGYFLNCYGYEKRAWLYQALFYGALGGIRTHGLQSRSLTRYPAAPRAPIMFARDIVAYFNCFEKAFFKYSNILLVGIC